MKNKFFLLSTIVSSCVFAIISNQSIADTGHSRMPTGVKRCYPGSKCTGDPNLIHRDGNRSEYPGNMHGNSNYGQQSGRMLRTDSLERFDGTVRSVERVRLPNETQIQIIVDTNQGERKVIVGPARYIDKSMVKLQAGDRVKIEGYIVRANGDEVIMAARIQKNGNTLNLLDDKRRPVWNQ